MFIPCAIRSSFTLSIHFFGCLPLLLVPSSCPYSATTGSLFPSILVIFVYHVEVSWSYMPGGDHSSPGRVRKPVGPLGPPSPSGVLPTPASCVGQLFGVP